MVFGYLMRLSTDSAALSPIENLTTVARLLDVEVRKKTEPTFFIIVPSLSPAKSSLNKVSCDVRASQ